MALSHTNVSTYKSKERTERNIRKYLSGAVLVTNNLVTNILVTDKLVTNNLVTSQFDN